MQLLIKLQLAKIKQFVSIGAYESACEKIDVGLPQGSVLGPLLFLIHTNDLQNKNFSDNNLYFRTFLKPHIYNSVKNLILNFKKS